MISYLVCVLFFSDDTFEKEVFNVSGTDRVETLALSNLLSKESDFEIRADFSCA